ncbi:hypothetical protein AMS66_05145, partial [Paenibacillus xylanivorans]
MQLYHLSTGHVRLDFALQQEITSPVPKRVKSIDPASRNLTSCDKELNNLMNYDPLYQPYPSYRVPVYAKQGMVATSQPLAAQAGLDVLKKGGNAIDAAIATAAALTVLEPTSNGIGGDAFALVWTGGKLHGLNASGPAPQSISIEALKAAGHSEMPKLGVVPVTVPGAPAGW